MGIITSLAQPCHLVNFSGICGSVWSKLIYNSILVLNKESPISHTTLCCCRAERHHKDSFYLAFVFTETSCKELLSRENFYIFYKICYKRYFSVPLVNAVVFSKKLRMELSSTHRGTMLFSLFSHVPVAGATTTLWRGN